MSSMVDWDLAAATGRRLVRPGPQISLDEATAAVSELRSATEQAEGHVRALTRMHSEVPSPPVRVVDRPDWIDVNCAGMSAVLSPLVDRLQERQDKPPGAIAMALGSRVTGVQAGAVLAFVAARVLGQYDVFSPSGGQLLLVAPNIVEAERRMEVNPSDFRLWVCLHEVTHRLQFTAVPWLADYMRAQIGDFVAATDLDPEVLKERLQTLLKAVIPSRGQAGDAGDAAGEGILALVQNPEQRAVLDRLTAMMSLVEGHAEYVMDEVGPSVVPSVATIRRRFGKRREGSGPLDRLLRRLLGLDQKMKQYADGRRFVSGAVAEVGMDGFNAVWSSPETLPRKEELGAPEDWVRRVHGRPQAIQA
ncbi:MAG: zinc-dependent metalloprotease [Geodermatophilaceae bacterium]